MINAPVRGGTATGIVSAQPYALSHSNSKGPQSE